MARKQQGSDFLTLAVMGIIFGAPFVLAALLFILRASALTVLFGFPLFILLGYFASRRLAFPAAPELPSEEQNIEELNLRKAKASAELTYINRLAQGEAEGFVLTQASNETRFDRRSPRARQLNRQLDELEERIASLEVQILELSTARGHDLALFKADLRQWVRKASLRDATKVAIVLTGSSSIILLLAHLAEFPILTFMDELLNWLRVPTSLIFPFKACAVGYLGAMITYPIARLIHGKRRALAIREHEESLPTNDLPNGYSPAIEVFEDDPVENEAFDDYEEPDDVEDWPQILNVDPDATIEEIKSAYRRQLKQYHPDNVATLGAKIREAAEAESKRINGAYMAARAHRQF
jgi:hypothetical protein